MTAFRIKHAVPAVNRRRGIPLWVPSLTSPPVPTRVNQNKTRVPDSKARSFFRINQTVPVSISAPPPPHERLLSSHVPSPRLGRGEGRPLGRGEGVPALQVEDSLRACYARMTNYVSGSVCSVDGVSCARYAARGFALGGQLPTGLRETATTISGPPDREKTVR